MLESNGKEVQVEVGNDSFTTPYYGCKFFTATHGNRWGEETGKTYYYTACPGVEPQVDEVVVVKCATGLQVVVVTEVNAVVPEDLLARITAPIIAIVDMAPYRTFEANEASKARLAQVMKQKRKELEGRLAYQLLAEKDPEFAKMLELYESLGGTFDV